MKTTKQLITAFCIMLTIAACTPKMSFVSSTIVPAASGTISVKKDKNSNYVSHVKVTNLADPKNLTPSKQMYIVWMESNGATVRKLGQLMPTGKSLNAEMTTSSVAKPDEIFITAEDNANIDNPEGQVVLSTRR